MSTIRTWVEARHYDLLKALLGQLSDGIWEHTTANTMYWSGVDVIKEDNGYCSLNVPENLFKRAKVDANGLLKKYARFIKKATKFNVIDNSFANLEVVFKKYIDSGKWFSEDNKDVCDYLSETYNGGATMTIADCVQAHHALMRGER